MNWLILTDPVEHAEILINMDHVQEIRAHRGGSVLKLNTGLSRRVAETLDELMETLLRAPAGE